MAWFISNKLVIPSSVILRERFANPVILRERFANPVILRERLATEGSPSLYPRILIALMLLCPTQTFACAVCGFTSAESRWAFLFTTGILTLTPLIMIGSVCYYLYRRAKALKMIGPEAVQSTEQVPTKLL